MGPNAVNPQCNPNSLLQRAAEYRELARTCCTREEKSDYLALASRLSALANLLVRPTESSTKTVPHPNGRHISARLRWGGARLERFPWSPEPKVTALSYADMGKRRLSDEEREQLERDRERFRFGTQGAASAVRKVDLASVDTAALVAQIERQPLAPSRAKKGCSRPAPQVILRKKIRLILFVSDQACRRPRPSGRL
jgi:hypothetical protein